MFDNFCRGSACRARFYSPPPGGAEKQLLVFRKPSNYFAPKPTGLNLSASYPVIIQVLRDIPKDIPDIFLLANMHRLPHTG